MDYKGRGPSIARASNPLIFSPGSRREKGSGSWSMASVLLLIFPVKSSLRLVTPRGQGLELTKKKFLRGLDGG